MIGESKLLRTLENLNIFEYQDIEELMSLLEFKKFSKEDVLVESGSFTNQIFYLNSGVLHSFFISENHKCITQLITLPDDFIAAFTPVMKNEKSKISIKAETDVEVIIFNYNDLKNLSIFHPKVEQFLSIIYRDYLTKLERRYFDLYENDAKTRYIELLENKPEFILNFPLKITASYLGITPRHLSRIRASSIK